MFIHKRIECGLIAGLVIAAASFAPVAQAEHATDVRTPAPIAHDQRHVAATEKRAAADITTAEANAMQAATVARGEANSALSNPYIEQKVTTPESIGVNPTRIPAGGF
jgi:hypothetical protein